LYNQAPKQNCTKATSTASHITQTILINTNFPIGNQTPKGHTNTLHKTRKTARRNERTNPKHLNKLNSKHQLQELTNYIKEKKKQDWVL
jgi:hypothetical protein